MCAYAWAFGFLGKELTGFIRNVEGFVTPKGSTSKIEPGLWVSRRIEAVTLEWLTPWGIFPYRCFFWQILLTVASPVTKAAFLIFEFRMKFTLSVWYRWIKDMLEERDSGWSRFELGHPNFLAVYLQLSMVGKQVAQKLTLMVPDTRESNSYR